MDETPAATTIGRSLRDTDASHGFLGGLKRLKDTRVGTKRNSGDVNEEQAHIATKQLSRISALETDAVLLPVQDDAATSLPDALTPSAALYEEEQPTPDTSAREWQSVLPGRRQTRRLIPYKDISPAFAVDVSGSTADGALQSEKEAIGALVEDLSTSAKRTSTIIPWNSRPGRPVSVSQIDELYPGGGTNPSHLTRDSHTCQILQRCPMWFLLTDGEISGSLIQKFAFGLRESHLHGKACVIILFGLQPSHPLSCNISVGQAVFAMAPDCAFLFHAIDTDDLYIFQCKGCFRDLLPQKDMEINLDDGTSWLNIPKTSYEALGKLSIPEPRIVDANTVVLEHGLEVDLESLYSNRLSPAQVSEILDSDDNLKSVLLTAQNQGRTEAVQAWLSQQKMSRGVNEYSPRPDKNNEAYNLVRQLVTAMREQVRDPGKEKELKRKLREAHLRNWLTFINSDKTTERNASHRNIVVEDALARVKLNREAPGSPRLMSPVTPRRSRRAEPQPSSYQYVSTSYGTYVDAGQVPSMSRPEPAEWSSPSGRQGAPSPARPIYADDFQKDGISQRTPSRSAPMAIPGSMTSPNSYQPSRLASSTKDSQLLYMRGYNLGERKPEDECFGGQCSLCDHHSLTLAMLLKAKPADCDTEDFPAPKSKQSIVFPLTLGNFPETDIISSYICCDRCAYFICRLGYSPIDVKITGAIPLVKFNNAANRQTMLKEIALGLEERFDHAIIDQIFLSVLVTALDDLKDVHDPQYNLFRSALSWQCQVFYHGIRLSAAYLCRSSGSAQSTILQSLPSTVADLVLQGVLVKDLLLYPVDGFVVLLRSAIETSTLTPGNHLTLTIFGRLVFHMVEQHFMLCEENGPDQATNELHHILAGDVGRMEKNRMQAEPEALEGTYLIDPEALESFRRLNEHFQEVELSCSVAIWAVLEMLRLHSAGVHSAEDWFDIMLASFRGSNVFTRPWALREEDCSGLFGDRTKGSAVSRA